MLEQNLAMAERHVGEAERIVEGQRRLLAELERDGHDNSLASQLLDTSELTLAMHLAERDRLRAILSGFGHGTRPGLGKGQDEVPRVIRGRGAVSLGDLSLCPRSLKHRINGRGQFGKVKGLLEPGAAPMLKLEHGFIVPCHQDGSDARRSGSISNIDARDFARKHYVGHDNIDVDLASFQN